MLNGAIIEVQSRGFGNQPQRRGALEVQSQPAPFAGPVADEAVVRPSGIGVFDGPRDLAANAGRHLDEGFGDE